MSETGLDRMVEALKGQARTEIRNAVTDAIPFNLKPSPDYKPNPDEGDESDEASGEEIPDDLSEKNMGFELSNAEDNLAGAAAAFRIQGLPDDIIATHGKTGYAYFGDEEGLTEYAVSIDLDDKDWKVYADVQEILALDYDPNTMSDIVDSWDSEGIEAARDQFEQFHWGDESQTTVVKTIDGIDGTLTYLGKGREICYGAQKDGKWEEYYHIFGEDSKTYPSVYALGDNTLVVHGGQMRIESAGIID